MSGVWPVSSYAEVLAELQAQDVRDVFGLMGDDTALFVSTLVASTDIRYVAARHEASCVGMADGYSRATGRVGMAVLSQGPGLTNAITAILTAERAGSAVVVVTGGSSSRIRGNPKYLAQGDLLRSIGVPEYSLGPGPRLADPLRRAFQAARTGRPVVVTLGPGGATSNGLPAPAARGADGDLGESHVQAAELTGATGRELDEVVGAVTRSERPVILAGRGAVRAGAREALIALAERIGAVLCTTLPAKGMFYGEPRNLGLAGVFGSPEAMATMAECDLLLAFGSSLSYFTTGAGAFLPRARVVAVNAAAQDKECGTDIWRYVRGNARSIAQQLTASFPREASPEAVRPAMNTLIAPPNPSTIRARADEATLSAGLDPRVLFMKLNKFLPTSRRIVVDGGHCCGFPCKYMEVTEPSKFIFSVDFGAVGSAIGPAIGMGVGQPEGWTLVSMGDGACLMSLGELETIARYDLPIMVVVLDDGAFGAERHYLEAFGFPATSAVFGEVNFAKVAESLGIRSIIVRTMNDFDALRRAVEAGEHPLLIDCKVDPSYRDSWMTEKLRMEFGLGT